MNRERKSDMVQEQMQVLSVEDFADDACDEADNSLDLVDSRVRRNLDKPIAIEEVCSTFRSKSREPSRGTTRRSETSNRESAAPYQGKSQLDDLNRADFEAVTPREVGNFDPSAFDRTPEQATPEQVTQRQVDASPTASCNASQILMKSLMTSYNAGNTAFYENLHRKYFDKAKKDGAAPGQGLDISKMGGKGEELSRFMADSRMLEGSRSRSRSRGATSNLLGASRISSASALLQNNKSTNQRREQNNSRTRNEAFQGSGDKSRQAVPELDQTQGVGVDDDDTHLFELTEKSNNTYMALSYWNHTQNAEATASQKPYAQTAFTMPKHAAVTQGTTTPDQTYRQNASHQKHLDEEGTPSQAADSNNAMSINFKNSIYSKIKYEPSVANFAPSQISARHYPMHSDASASQISTMHLTSKILGGRNEGGTAFKNECATNRERGYPGVAGDGEIAQTEDCAQSEIPYGEAAKFGEAFISRRQQLLSSSGGSSPEIKAVTDVGAQEDDFAREIAPRGGHRGSRNDIDVDKSLQRKSRLGSSSRGNKSVPNIEDAGKLGLYSRFGRYQQEPIRDELSRRDLSARYEPQADEAETAFEVATQDFSEKQITLKSHSPKQATGHSSNRDQTGKTAFSDLRNVLPDTMPNPLKEQPQYFNQDAQARRGDTNTFLNELQDLGSPESPSTGSYQPNHLFQQHRFLQTDDYQSSEPNVAIKLPESTQKAGQHPLAERQMSTDDLQPIDQAAGKIAGEQSAEQVKENPSLLAAFQEQVKLARATRLQSQGPLGQGVAQTEDQLAARQASLISQQYDSVPTAPNNHLLQILREKQRLFTSQKEDLQTNHHHNDSRLDPDHHLRSDFTFVLSQPTQGGFTEHQNQPSCTNCGVGNGSILLDNVNGSILQSHGLRSSIGDTSMQIRKKVLTNFYANGNPVQPPTLTPHQGQQVLPHSGTASFPDGVFQTGTAQSTEARVMHIEAESNEQVQSQRPLLSGGLKNRLAEIAASPIYSDGGGAPGRKFFINSSNQQRKSYGQNGALLRPQQQPGNQAPQQALVANSQGQLRLSQIMQMPSSHEAMVPLVTENENLCTVSEKCASPQAAPRQAHPESEEPQDLHDLFTRQQQELNHARTLLACSYDHVHRVLQHGWTAEAQDEAVKLLQVIQEATWLGGEESPAKSNDEVAQQQMGQVYGQIPEALAEESEDDHPGLPPLQLREQNAAGDQSRAGQDAMLDETDQIVDSARHQMTESEFDDDRSKLTDTADKVFYLPKQVVDKKPVYKRQTTQGSTERLSTDDQKRANLKNNSLLSSAVQDGGTLYDLDKDTVYSFFAEESEIRPRKNNPKQGPGVDFGEDTDCRTSFIRSRSPREYKQKANPAGETEHDEPDEFARTKTQLKNERRLNREQADELKRMQAQIDALTQKWSITENQLRANGAIYSMYQPPQQNQLGFQGTSQQQQNQWQPTATALTQRPSAQAFYSVIGGVNTSHHQQNHQAQHYFQGRSMLLSEVPGHQPQAAQSMLGTHTPFSPSMLGGGHPTPTTTGPNLGGPGQAPLQQPSSPFLGTEGRSQQMTPSLASHQSQSVQSIGQVPMPEDCGLPRSGVEPSSAQAADQSKHLIELNERLQKQIESNMTILGHMGQPRQQVGAQSPYVGTHGNASNLSLGSIDLQNATALNAVQANPRHTPTPSNANTFITLSNITPEESLEAQTKHKQDMEKLRQRQLAFTAKIQKVNSKLLQQRSPPALSAKQIKIGLKAAIVQGKDKTETEAQQPVQEGDGGQTPASDDTVPTKEN